VSRLRLGTFNLLSGRSMTDGRIEANRLVDAVAAIGADVLALQEVDRGQPRSGSVDQAAMAAAALGSRDMRYVETVRGTPGEDGWGAAPHDDSHDSHDDSHDDGTHGEPAQNGSRVPEGGRNAAGPGFGIALLSRVPVSQWHVMRLDAAPGRYPIVIPSRPPRVLWLRDEPRAVLAAVLEEPRLTVACTHLSFVPWVNVSQLRRLRTWLDGFPAPRILLGDLNLTPGLARRATRWTSLVSAPTFPSPSPRWQLDHILAGGLPVGARSAGRVQHLPISDHRAALVDLELP
jgi:endonuclease/exonuclease/phosphatase family metal-dependent hydrolase